jgi:hypothetical protein
MMTRNNMKKRGWTLLPVALLLCVAFAACNGGSTGGGNAASGENSAGDNAGLTGDAARLVGSWSGIEGRMWTFNADGTGQSGGNPFWFGAIGGKLVVQYSRYAGDRYVYDLVFSKDGKALIISTGDGYGDYLRKAD